MIGPVDFTVDRFASEHRTPSEHTRRINSGNVQQNKAAEARQKAESHIQNGTGGIVDGILGRIDEESSRGRFELTHMIKGPSAHLVPHVVKGLKDHGFNVEIIGEPTQREPETSLKISW